MKKLLKIILFLAICVITNGLTAQNWTPPINVSNTNGFIIHSDFTIDNEGVIHCVWDFKHNSNFGVIYYSFSQDNGYTWSEKEIISQNDTNFCASPQIVVDSENNVFVVYDLNDYSPQNWGSYTTLVVKEDGEWKDPLIISEGIGSFPVIDYNDRLYVFWFEGAPHNGEFHYQFLEGSTWSEIFCPFDNDELTGLISIVVDDSNNLHCSGLHDSTGSNNSLPMYLKYSYQSGEWSDILTFNDDNPAGTIDIALDTNQLPHMCWGSDALYYKFYNGFNWEETDTLTFNDPRKSKIEIDDSNYLHIAINTNSSNGMRLLYFKKYNEDYWINEVIDSSNNVIFTPELEYFDTTLFLVYKKSEIPGNGDVFLSFKDLLTHTTNLFKNIQFLENYPNPFNKSIQIRFFLNKVCPFELCIYNLQGVKVYSVKTVNTNPGLNSIIWDGTSNSGERLNSGYYNYIIKAEGNVYSNKILFLK